MNIQKILVGEKFQNFFHKNKSLNTPLFTENKRLKKEFAIKYNVTIKYVNECSDLYSNSLYSKI